MANKEKEADERLFNLALHNMPLTDKELNEIPKWPLFTFLLILIAFVIAINLIK